MFRSDTIRVVSLRPKEKLENICYCSDKYVMAADKGREGAIALLYCVTRYVASASARPALFTEVLA